MTDKLFKLCKKAAEIIHSFPEPTRVRVVSHYDADGITAAAIMSKALHRAGYNFHTTLMRNPFDKGLERVSKEDNDLIIFLDMGSGQIETIEKMNCKSIIVDHHQYLKEKTAENVFQINANLCDINGNYEACGSTLVYSLVKALDPVNKDLVAFAIAGATGDKQYIGGIRGYNKDVVDEALKEGLVEKKIEIKLYGDTIFDALYYSADPYYSGLSGNKKDDELHVSCRGTQYLVSKGLDLGLAMKEAANQFGGHGGGHAIASGATIDARKEEDFLKIVDEIIGKQLGG